LWLQSSTDLGISRQSHDKARKYFLSRLSFPSDLHLLASLHCRALLPGTKTVSILTIPSVHRGSTQVRTTYPSVSRPGPTEFNPEPFGLLHSRSCYPRHPRLGEGSPGATLGSSPCFGCTRLSNYYFSICTNGE
jgi:hypothetical protein